jgi:hypothetical protein
VADRPFKVLAIFSEPLVSERKRGKKLARLVFITGEKHGRPSLDAPMPVSKLPTCRAGV